MGRRGKRTLWVALLFLCNVLQLLIGKQIAVTAAAVSSASQNDDRFPSGARGGPPQPIVQRRTFDTSSSDSWSFFTIGSSNLRDKRKLPGTSNLPGQAGKETISDFSCRGRPPGYYADIKLGCEVYHLCNRHGGGMAFECPRGTRFQQRTMVCDHEHLVQCHNSEQYFHSNLRIGQANLNFIDDRRKSSKPNQVGINDDVFMQVVVREHNNNKPEIGRTTKSRGNHRMQLVFKQNQLAEKQHQQHHDHQHHFGRTKSSLLKGRGKDSFFLVAQDEDTPEVIRDSRKVPKNILNQVSSLPPKRIKSSKLPTFPNYPVKLKDKTAEERLTFHQAYGTDFDRFRRRPSSTTLRPLTTTSISSPTTKKPSFILTPPDLNAPVAKFYSGGKRPKRLQSKNPLSLRTRKKSLKKKHRLPHNHPLSQVLPPTARVVGIQPLRQIPLSNRDKNAEIMTLGDFLAKFPTMEKMRSASIVPVPVTDEKHIRMIERLAANRSLKDRHHHNDLDEMFKELEQLISKRAERKISFTHKHSHNHHHHNKHEESTDSDKAQGLNVRPRGGLPGPRFMTTPRPSASTKSLVHFSTKPTKKTTPKLEFGFVPIISSSTTPRPLTTKKSTFNFSTQRTPLGSRLRFASFDDISETDQLVAPRLPRQPDTETNEIDDAFFFTTTPKPGVSPAVSTVKPGIFDMRKFFFIPNKNVPNLQQNSLQAERRVHHFNHLPPPPPPHRGFFRG